MCKNKTYAYSSKEKAIISLVDDERPESVRLKEAEQDFMKIKFYRQHKR